MKNRAVLSKCANGRYAAYQLLKLKPGVLFLIDNTFYFCTFLGTGAIYIWRKRKGEKQYLEISRVHPHYERASIIGMMFCAYDVCKMYERDYTIASSTLSSL